MTIDGFILSAAFLGSIIFVFVFSLLILRSPTYPFRAMYSGFICGVFSVGLFALIANMFLSTIIIAFFLYTLLTAFYILGIYLNIDSSLHVRILQEVARAGSRGLTYGQLLRKYNKNTILYKRLSWLVKSGEVEKNGNTLYRKRNLSMLFFREISIRFLRKLYGT